MGRFYFWPDEYFSEPDQRSGDRCRRSPCGGSQIRCHCLALKTNGTMTAWGRISLTNIPTSILNKGVAMAGGIGHSIALKSDGTVVTWGDPIISGGDVNAPPPRDVTNVVAVAAGAGFNLALTAAGIVRAWTPTPYFANVTNVPAGLSNVVAIAAGFRHALALKADGTVAAWGDNSSGQLGVPSGLANIVAIAAGDFHNLALKSNGTIVAWGDNSKGQLNIPTGVKNVAAIAAGGYFSLALIGDGPPVVRAAVANVTWQGNSLRSFWPSQSGRVYRLEYKNSLTDSLWIPLPLAPGNGAM